MRRLLLLAGLVLALGGSMADVAGANQKAKAAGQCVCRTWAQQFIKRPAAQAAFDQGLFWVVSDAKKKKIRKGIYDYAKTGDLDDSWCKRNRRICKAVIACLIGGGGAYGAARVAGASVKASTVSGAVTCAYNAATVMLSP